LEDRRTILPLALAPLRAEFELDLGAEGPSARKDDL